MKEENPVIGQIVYGLVCLILIFSIFCISITCASLNTTATVGETWIKWSWDLNNSVDVYIDGVLAEESLPSSLYLLSDLQPSEEHDIALYNSTGGELLDSHTATTLPSLMLVVALLMISGLFAVLTLILSDIYRVILCAGVASVISAYCTTLAISHFFGLAILSLIIAGFSVVVVVLSIMDFWEREDDDD